MSDYPRAVVAMIDGQPVLFDPDAAAMIRAIEKTNCRNLLELNADRIRHFKQRLAEKKLTPMDALIVVINVDAPHGADLAEMLMPGHNWQEYRDNGEVPISRGLANRRGIEAWLGEIDKETQTKLRELVGIAVLVVDRGVVEIFSAEEVG